MKTEAKAKVVASVWGATFFQFLAALAVLPQLIWKIRMNSTVSHKPTKAKQLARKGNEQNLPPQTEATTFAFASPSILLLCLYAWFDRWTMGGRLRGRKILQNSIYSIYHLLERVEEDGLVKLALCD